MATVTDPRDIILAPVISEKSYGLIEDNTYTFIVAPESNKTQIKIAIEKIFDVKVDSVNTANRKLPFSFSSLPGRAIHFSRSISPSVPLPRKICWK